MDKKIEVNIKKVTSDEPNVSKRGVTYDVYHNGKYHTTFKDINDAMDHKEKMHKESVDLNERVLTIQQRQKRAQIMRRIQPRIERAREIARKRMAPAGNIRKRAFMQARQLVRRRVAGARGAEYEKLGPSEKIAIDRAVEGKQKIIKTLAMRLIPRIRRAEAIRLSSFMKGQAMHNLGKPEGKSKGSSASSSVNKNIDILFSEAFPQLDADTINMKGGSKFASKDKKPTDGSKTKNSPIIQYSKFQEEIEYDTPAFAALFKKSDKSGIDLEVLGEVYNRGWNAWTEDCSVSQQQYAFARVNSFINQGQTYFNEDSDLHEMKTVTNRSHAKVLKIEVGGRQHAYKKYSWGLHQPRHGPLKDSDFKSKAEMKAAMEKHPAYNPNLRESADIEEARPVNNPAYDHSEKMWNQGKKEFDAKLDTKGRFTKNTVRKMFGKLSPDAEGIKEDEDIQELSKEKLADYLDKSQSGRQHPTPEKFRSSAKMATIAAKKIGKRFPGSGQRSVKVKATNEAREPGKPSITRYKRPDGTTALKSLNKWGKRKDWQDTEGGLKKAREHSKSDLSEENTHKVVGVKGKPTGDRWEMHTRLAGEPGEYSTIIKTHQNGKHVKNQWGGYNLYKTGKTAYIKKHFDKLSEETITKKHAAPTKGKVIPDASLDHVKKIADHVISRYGRGLTDKHVLSAAEDFGVGVAQLKRHIRHKTGQMKSGRAAYEVHKDEVQQSNENFIDGKGPGKPGDASRHGLKGKSATELRKIRSSETTSPRRKQLAHWMLNMHHNESVDEGLKNPDDNPCWKGYKPVGTKKLRSNTVPNCVPVNEEERTDPKVKVEGTNCRNCVYWRKDLEKPVTKGELNPNGGLKAPNKEYIAMSKRVDLGTLPGRDNSVKIKGFCDHDDIQDWVTERMCCSQWDSDGMVRDYKGKSPVMEDGESILPQTTSPGSRVRKKIEAVDRAPPHTEHGKQSQIMKKIIDEEGNSQPDPKKRLIGTDPLVKALKKDTPGEDKNINEAFNIAFASGVGVTLTSADLGMKVQGGFQLHPSVIEQMDEMEEEVRSADVKGVVVHTASGKTVVRKQKANRKIIGTGNLTDGQANDTI